MVLAADLAVGLDPVRLTERAGLVPNPWQAQVLRSAAPWLLLNGSRQTGKSPMTGCLECTRPCATPARWCCCSPPVLAV